MEPQAAVESKAEAKHEENKASQQMWHTTTAQVVEHNRAARLKKSVVSLDGYKVEPTQGSTCGGIISLLIWPLVVLYTIIVVVAIIRAPLETSNQIRWSMGEGPYPMDVHCRSVTGCYLHNRYFGSPMETGAPGMGIPDKPDHGWDISGSCRYLAEGESASLDVFFTGLASDGVSVLFDPGATSVGAPPHTGFFIDSQMNMDCGSPPLADCHDGVIPMPSYVDAGRFTVNYVRTTNETRKHQGRTRHEWFVTKTAPSADGIEEHACYGRMVEDKGTAAAAGFQLTHVPMAPFWNHITVKSKDGLWFTIIPSTMGGAYGLLYEVGALVLFTWGAATAGWAVATKSGASRKGVEPV